MASVRLWRRISLWLWLSCLLLAACSAPVNEDGSVSEKSDDDFGSAIEAIARAKRDTRKKSSKSGRSLVRYRYPIQMKRSGMKEEDEDDYDGGNSAEDERREELGALFGPDDQLLDRNDNAVDLDELAKEMALDILMEEADKSREHHRSLPLMKKKKAAPTAHRPRYSLSSSADDKRRKRMNSLVNQLLADGQDEHSGPVDNEEGEEEDEEEEEEENISRSVARALAKQGLDHDEIDNLLSELERLQSEGSGGEKKKRSSDLKKLPRASLRWRFLHSNGFEDKELGHQDHDDDEGSYSAFSEERQDKSVPFRNRFFGRGFHRVGPSIQDDIPSMAAKRVQRPLKTKNAVSVVNKRSVASQKEELAPKSRKRRSPADDVVSKLNETSPPLALPLAEQKSQNASAQNKSESKDRKDATGQQVHSGVIRKKSVDWDDYFGYDKRSGKSGEDEAMRDYLESDYYKNMAGSLAYRKRMDNHVGHGMKKRSNATSLEKKRRDFRLEDAEEALDAALRAVEETGDGDIERVKERLVAELVENLDEEELEEMTERLSEELAKAVREEEEEDDDDETSNFNKRSAIKKRVAHKKKKKNSSNDDRRKRFAIKRSDRHHPEDGADDCVIAEQVVTTCNMVSHLYGGYRPVLSDACFRHQACFICSDNEAACDVEFQRRVLALCGPDLLCQSQSRHLLSALGQLEQMEADYLVPMGGQPRIEALCRRDSCLAEFWKRR